MLSRQSLPTIIVVMACALLTLILTLLSAGLSLSHDPMMGSQLQQLASAQSYASDVVMHEHANHSTEDMPSSHQHGHSNVDHTHESLFLPPEHTTVSEFGEPVRNFVCEAYHSPKGVSCPARQRSPLSAAKWHSHKFQPSYSKS